MLKCSTVSCRHSYKQDELNRNPTCKCSPLQRTQYVINQSVYKQWLSLLSGRQSLEYKSPLSFTCCKQIKLPNDNHVSLLNGTLEAAHPLCSVTGGPSPQCDFLSHMQYPQGGLTTSGTLHTPSSNQAGIT